MEEERHMAEALTSHTDIEMRMRYPPQLAVPRGINFPRISVIVAERQYGNRAVEFLHVEPNSLQRIDSTDLSYEITDRGA